MAVGHLSLENAASNAAAARQTSILTLGIRCEFVHACYHSARERVHLTRIHAVRQGYRVAAMHRANPWSPEAKERGRDTNKRESTRKRSGLIAGCGDWSDHAIWLARSKLGVFFGLVLSTVPGPVQLSATNT